MVNLWSRQSTVHEAIPILVWIDLVQDVWWILDAPSPLAWMVTSPVIGIRDGELSRHIYYCINILQQKSAKQRTCTILQGITERDRGIRGC